MAANQKLTAILAGRTVKGVRQRGAALYIDFTDGATLEIRLAEPASCVMLRDAKKALEYAD